MAGYDQEAPPPGEQIHFPGPSIIPFLNAVAVTIALLGVTTSWILIVLGGVLFLWTTVRWVADSRREFSELPAEHH